MREKKYKNCPRCNKRNLINQEKCVNCGLIFERLKKVTNRAGKEAIKNKEFNKVIYTNDLPADVNKWKIFILNLFLGAFGAHFAYVGRYKFFYYNLISSLILIVFVALISVEIIPENFIYTSIGETISFFITLPTAINLIICFNSLVQILFNKFKVPVSIDEEYVVDDLNREVAYDILKNVKEDRENEKKHKN